MTTSRLQRLLRTGMILAAVLGAGGAAADRRALQHDVFARPSLNERAAERGADRTAPAPEPEAWQPQLRAIVLAGPRSMVLVDRSTVELGASIAGHRLVDVTEGKAVFVRGGQRVELTLGRSAADVR
jgi:hypothetical protein